MQDMTTKERIENFYERVKAYRTLLLDARNENLTAIEEVKKIKEEKQCLIREYAKLEVYIKKYGKNAKMSDGVWNIWYSPYDNAFTDDIIQRIGPSLDAVINDLDWIIGKLENISEDDIKEQDSRKISSSKDHLEIKKLTSKIDECLNLAEQKLLKGEELEQLVSELKKIDVSEIVNDILKRKIEKLKKEPNTVWSDIKGYAISGVQLLTPWKQLFLELNAGASSVSQKYFRPGSREEIYEYLKTLIPGGQTIKIYDNYLDEEILKLLEQASKDSEIFILGSTFKPGFKNKIEAFKIYFERNIQYKKTDDSHARFYIIDGNVFNVDVSLAGKGADKATMISPVIKTEAEEIIKDYEEWWSGAKDLLT